MKIIFVPIAVLAFVSASSIAWSQLIPRGNLVIGGVYVIHSGEVMSGNLDAVFAQVTLEDGARVEGRILSVSSALDLAGSVSGDILSIGSDIRVRETARLKQGPRELQTFPYVVLLPQMARAQNIGAR
jgi:hypothetical protein